jgi:hypothetical protein
VHRIVKAFQLFWTEDGGRRHSSSVLRQTQNEYVIRCTKHYKRVMERRNDVMERRNGVREPHKSVMEWRNGVHEYRNGVWETRTPDMRSAIRPIPRAMAPDILSWPLYSAEQMIGLGLEVGDRR